MFQQWLNNLQHGAEENEARDQHWVERVSALLLVEIPHADTETDETELAAVAKAIKLGR